MLYSRRRPDLAIGIGCNYKRVHKMLLHMLHDGDLVSPARRHQLHHPGHPYLASTLTGTETIPSLIDVPSVSSVSNVSNVPTIENGTNQFDFFLQRSMSQLSQVSQMSQMSQPLKMAQISFVFYLQPIPRPQLKTRTSQANQ